MSAHPTPDRLETPVAVQVLAALGVMLVLVAGIFVWGRLANDDRTAMALTGAWFALVLVAGALLTRRRTSLRLPLGVGFGVVAAAATILLGLPMLGDDVVSERVVTGEPQVAAAAPAPAPAPAAEPDAAPRPAPAPARNIQVASGAFQSIVHQGSGKAAVVKLVSGKRMLTLTSFETDNGPDLRVYVSTGNPHGGGDLGDFEDLGALKGNKGNQQYELPSDVDIGRFSTVVVWCRAFSVPFTSAVLRES